MPLLERSRHHPPQRQPRRQVHTARCEPLTSLCKVYSRGIRLHLPVGDMAESEAASSSSNSAWLLVKPATCLSIQCPFLLCMSADR